jgi:hypothetical protein
MLGAPAAKLMACCHPTFGQSRCLTVRHRVIAPPDERLAPLGDLLTPCLLVKHKDLVARADIDIGL